MYLAGAAIDDVGRRGRPIFDDDFLAMFNAHADDVGFTIPAIAGQPWRPLIDTVIPDGLPPLRAWHPGDVYPLRGRSLVLLTRPMAVVTREAVEG
jgi:glycogen operon protein